jgi:hypothetical protein
MPEIRQDSIPSAAEEKMMNPHRHSGFNNSFYQVCDVLTRGNLKLILVRFLAR